MGIAIISALHRTRAGGKRLAILFRFIVGPILLGLTMPAVADDAFRFGCGEPRKPGMGLIPIDYRERVISEKVAGSVAQLNSFHTDIARAEMSKPVPYSPNVAGNLDFSLRHCPNHHVALAAMIDWELRGGAFYKLPSSKCYLEWALRFAPEDVTVLTYGGNYFAKKGDKIRAVAWYERALELDESSVETHYNYGLFLADQKNYQSAVRHAQLAYAAGFPLTGLRRKLERAGYSIPAASAVPERVRGD